MRMELSQVHFLCLNEKWDQLMDQLTLEEAANFIEKAGDKNFEKLDSIFLPEAIWYDGPIGYSYDPDCRICNPLE